MKVITVCGSLRFKKEMMEITEKIGLQGNCMLTPIFTTKESKSDYTENEISILSEMHFQKIKMCDAILVVNVNGYIGEQTKKEIEYAKYLNKEIIYYTDIINNEI